MQSGLSKTSNLMCESERLVTSLEGKMNQWENWQKTATLVLNFAEKCFVAENCSCELCKARDRVFYSHFPRAEITREGCSVFGQGHVALEEKLWSTIKRAKCLPSFLCRPKQLLISASGPRKRALRRVGESGLLLLSKP